VYLVVMIKYIISYRLKETPAEITLQQYEMKFHRCFGNTNCLIK